MYLVVGMDVCGVCGSLGFRVGLLVAVVLDAPLSIYSYSLPSRAYVNVSLCPAEYLIIIRVSFL